MPVTYGQVSAHARRFGVAGAVGATVARNGKRRPVLAEALQDFYEKSYLALDRRMRAVGSSVIQARVLSFLAQTVEPRSVDITDAFHYAPRTVTMALDCLEQRGLIVRRRSDRDKRAKIIDITIAGHEVIAAAAPAARQFEEALFCALSIDERAVLTTLLGKLNHRLDGIADVRQ